MLGLCKCVPPKPVVGGWLRQWLGSVTARRERMYVAYGSTLAATPLSVSMVRTYFRKGGHGGDRSKAGLPACYWHEKGGRAAAAAAPKAAAKAKELLEEEAAKAAATNRWKQ